MCSCPRILDYLCALACLFPALFVYLSSMVYFVCCCCCCLCRGIGFWVGSMVYFCVLRVCACVHAICTQCVCVRAHERLCLYAMLCMNVYAMHIVRL